MNITIQKHDKYNCNDFFDFTIIFSLKNNIFMQK